VAALIKTRFNQDTALQPGGRGEFSIWVDGKKIVEKTRTGFPSEAALIESLTTALE
jgi:predicted Rdx family selenoprotein